MTVISNSSPLILYARIGALHLLPALFGAVIVPLAVHDEVVAAARGRAGADVVAAPWLSVRALAAPERMPAAVAALDRGEAEALALALELHDAALPVLIDDRKGRRTAAQLGIRVYGSAGVLLVAKQRGLVVAVRPLLDGLQRAGLYLGITTRLQLLKMAGEPPED